MRFKNIKKSCWLVMSLLKEGDNVGWNGQGVGGALLIRHWPDPPCPSVIAVQIHHWRACHSVTDRNRLLGQVSTISGRQTVVGKHAALGTLGLSK